jgi:hypothetical protein
MKCCGGIGARVHWEVIDKISLLEKCAPTVLLSRVSHYLKFNFLNEFFVRGLTFPEARELRISHDGFIFFRFKEEKTFHGPLLSYTSCPILFILRLTTSFWL